MNPGTRGIAPLLVLLVLFSSVVGPAGATAASTQTGVSDAVTVPVAVAGVGHGSPAPQVTTTQPTANETPAANDTDSTTVRHENPDDADEGGSTDRLSRYLTAQLVDRLNGSTVQLSRGDYERARTLVGDDYDRTLEKYATVIDEPRSNESVRAFDSAGANQRTFAESVQTYWTAFDEYRRAKQTGDEGRAREIARQLNETATVVNQSGTRLQADYRRVSTDTSVDLNGSARTVEAIQRNVTAQQSNVVTDEFVATSLTVQSDGTTASFVDPLRLTGLLVTANQTPVANESVTFRIENQTYRTVTDRDGVVTLAYHPVTLPVDAETVTVEFLPANDSVYLPSNATTPIRVQQVTPEVTLTDTRTSVRYGDPLVVGGRVGIGNVSAPNVPVVVTAHDVVVGETQTNESGAFEVNATLPASVPSGTRDVVVRVSDPGTALGQTNDSFAVDVVETETELSLTPTISPRGRVTVQGVLRTADARIVSGQRVEIRLDGVLVETVTTGTNGQYATTVSLPAETQRANQTVNVSVAYDGTGTNLASSRATEDVIVSNPSRAGVAAQIQSVVAGLWRVAMAARADISVPASITGNPLLVSALTVVVLFVAVLGRNAATVLTGRPTGTGKANPSLRSSKDASSESSSGTTPASRSVQELLSSGATDAAIVEAYRLVRTRLAGESGVRNRGTCWEFYESVRATDSIIDVDAFERLTERYEFAAFAADETAEDDARATVELAQHILTDRQ